MKIFLLGVCLIGNVVPSIAQLIKTLHMPLDDSLKISANVYSVRQKFSFAQGKAAMHFGPYLAQVQFDLLNVKSRSGRFRAQGGSFTTTYRDVRNPMHFSFQLADSLQSFYSLTTCTNQIEREVTGQLTYRWVKTFLGSMPEVNRVFAGSMLNRSDTLRADPTEEPNWNFVIYNTTSGMVNDTARAVVGLISNDDQSVQISIKAITGYSVKTPSWMRNDSTGYEFRYNNQLIGATELIPQGFGKGRVWLKNDLPKDLKFVIANVAEAILVENGLNSQ